MKLPKIRAGKPWMKQRIVDFRGLNYNPRIEDGEMRDMQNLTSDQYPALSVRKARSESDQTFTDPADMISKGEKLAIIDGNSFYYDGVKKGEFVLPGKKTMAAIQNAIYFFPDGASYDIQTDQWIGVSAPTYHVNYNPNWNFGEGEITSTSVVRDKFFPEIRFGKNYVENFDLSNHRIEKGDTVQMIGCTNPQYNISAKVESVEAQEEEIREQGEIKFTLVTLITPSKITFETDVFPAAYEQNSVDNPISLVLMPKEENKIDLEFFMENNNRLWGCMGNEIRASALGNPTAWNSFAGLSGDSYAVTVGTDGDFTGCASYANQLLFFKENYIHILTGTKPSNYQITTLQCHGLQKGCEKSLCKINETLYYKSRVGVMAYQGGIPQLISSQFGLVQYGTATAGTDGIKYYLSAQRGNIWDMLVYDTRRGLWHKEDGTHALCFANCAGILSYIDAEQKKLFTINSNEKQRIPWFAQLGEFTEQQEDRKILSKLFFRIDMEKDSELHIRIQYDGGTWNSVYNAAALEDKTIFLPLIPRRCDRFAIRLEGIGSCVVHSMTREFRTGGEY